jgi:hypothetical protein
MTHRWHIDGTHTRLLSMNIINIHTQHSMNSNDIQTTISNVFDHPLFLPICVIIIGLYSPFLCHENTEPIAVLFNDARFRVAVLVLIAVTSIYDIQLALLWAITYIVLWSCVWNYETKKASYKK